MQKITNAWLLTRCLRGIVRVIRDAGNVGTAADGIHGIRNARSEADDAMNMVRDGNAAAQVIQHQSGRRGGQRQRKQDCCTRAGLFQRDDSSAMRRNAWVESSEHVFSANSVRRDFRKGGFLRPRLGRRRCSSALPSKPNWPWTRIWPVS